MSTDYTNDSQQRILRLIEVLAGHEVKGLAPSDIAQRMECGAGTVTRDTRNLQTAGWAELVRDSSNWRLSPKAIQLVTQHATALARAQAEIDEIKNRFSRS